MKLIEIIESVENSFVRSLNALRPQLAKAATATIEAFDWYGGVKIVVDVPSYEEWDNNLNRWVFSDYYEGVNELDDIDIEVID